MAKQKNKKKRKPKGKKLSDQLAEKKALKDVDAELDAAAVPSDTDDDEPAGDGLDSEPPPSFSDADADDADADAADADDAPEPGAGDDDDEEVPPSAAEDDDEYEYYDDDEDEDEAAAQMGHARYVIAGFFGLLIVVGYIAGQAVETFWSNWAAEDWFVVNLPMLAAVPYEGALISRSSVSGVIGFIIGGLVVLRYYYKPDVRQWADEVAEQLAKVKWPTRKEVGNNTVVVMIATAMFTIFLGLLDRFWDFVTTLIYSSGT
jgi:preprotein translocase subunit SecE